MSMAAALLRKNRDARLEVRCLNVGDQAPLEAGNQAIFKALDLVGWTVAGEEDLAPRLEEIVKGMEEFFLRALFPREKVDIIDQAAHRRCGNTCGTWSACSHGWRE